MYRNMIRIIKSSVQKLINILVFVLGKTAVGCYIFDRVIIDAMMRVQKVKHLDFTLTFSIPNALSKYRVDTFSTKEPETLEWIDNLPRDSVVWDIGANIGLYTCYAIKARGCRVFAFEPSVFNLELLARNISLNDIADQATIVPLPLSDELAFDKLNLTTTVWGGAMSTFRQDYGHDGQIFDKAFAFPTVGLSMVEAVSLLGIPQPDYIKMDVDGIEHLILKGGMPILLKTKGVLIEINDRFTIQASEASKYLREANFILKEKRHADYFDDVTTAARHTYNQIWVK
jgi:FkbM family methyltransferase